MKKLLFIGLMLASSIQAYAFPSLANYGFKTEVSWNENAKSNVLMFNQKDKLHKILKVSSPNFNGLYALCPNTGYHIYVSGEWGNHEIIILDKQGNREQSDYVIYIDNVGFIGKFDEGCILIFYSENHYWFYWAEYVD